MEILRKFSMMDYKSMATPMMKNLKKLSDLTSYLYLVDPSMQKESIGSLVYLVNTRLDIFFVVRTLNQLIVEMRQFHWVASKHMLRYLHGMVGYGMRYVSGGEVRLEEYTYYDSAGSGIESKSTSGCCFSLRLAMISWISRKQNFVALSTTKVEYITASVASREAVWIQKLLAGLFYQELETTLIHCDNQSFVKLLENPVFHDR
jgi:hypothetical protein